MAVTDQLSVTATWNAAARITATGDTPVYLPNTADKIVYWALTEDDTAPAMAEAQGNPVTPFVAPYRDLSAISMTLQDGERLWLVSPDGNVTLPKTVG
jgi:hypothetical protein